MDRHFNFNSDRDDAVLDRLVSYLDTTAAVSVGEGVSLDDARLAPKLALAKAHDPRVHALMHLVVTRNTSFCVYDVAVFPECFVREPWDAAAIGPGDVCLAKNGGGDLYIWNAERGDVRFVIHDEAWETRRTYDNVDQFVEAVLQAVVELADADQVDEADDAYLARLCFAIEVAGEDGLDAEARVRLAEKGFCSAGWREAPHP